MIPLRESDLFFFFQLDTLGIRRGAALFEDLSL